MILYKGHSVYSCLAHVHPLRHSYSSSVQLFYIDTNHQHEYRYQRNQLVFHLIITMAQIYHRGNLHDPRKNAHPS